MDSERGIEVFVFHRTMSFGNWPFLVLILIIATAASTSFILDGKWVGVALVFGSVCAIPLVTAVVQFLPELFGARVLVGVYARGVVWARLWQRGFIPWANLEQVGPGERLWQVNERRGAGKPISLTSVTNDAAIDFIAERLPGKATRCSQ